MFAEWNQGRLDSYLIEITADILGHLDERRAQRRSISILDAAGQKGTGKWTVVAVDGRGRPAVALVGGVGVRTGSSPRFKDQRTHVLQPTSRCRRSAHHDDPEAVIADLHDALYGSKIVSYAQGFMLIRTASDDRGWNLDSGTIAGLWRAGCIIRSRFLADITRAYRANPNAAEPAPRRLLRRQRSHRCSPGGDARSHEP